MSEVTYVSMSELCDVFSRRKTLADIRIERLHAEIMGTLMRLDVATLRRMWDGVGEDSFYHGAEGTFDCSDIHTALNRKGDGIYCAV